MLRLCIVCDEVSSGQFAFSSSISSSNYAMVTIGLVGGVASGKSLVAADFQKLGACVLDGDRVGHEVLLFDDVVKQLTARWGDRVLSEDGKLDRSSIAKIVFQGDPKSAEQELAFLESITHPEIEKQLRERISQVKSVGRFPVTVLDAAVMFKAGWDAMCDRIVFVDAPQELREKRAMLRGLESSQFAARDKAQMSVEEKKKRADIIIDNSGPPQKTFKQVQEVWQSLLQMA